jgi:pyruvate kinase
MVAASFVSGAEDILKVRRVLEDEGSEARVFAKVESRAGANHLEEILRAADGLMVARGDLGVELPVEQIPLLQKRMISLARRQGRPVITATQMLESMTERETPTRAEATDVANAILDGTDAVMLSAETASGRHPVEAVEVMARLAEETERAPEFYSLLRPPTGMREATVTEAVSQAACELAEHLEVQAIVAATSTGFTARMLARHRPRPPVLAVTPTEAAARSLTVVWGVRPVVDPEGVIRLDADEHALFERALAVVRQAGLVADGDLVVVTGGIPAGVPGTTNMVQVRTVGDALVRGHGIGTRSVTAPVRLLRPGEGESRELRGFVVVATDVEGMDLTRLAGAAALVVEAPGQTGTAAVVALSYGIPAVTGARGAMTALRDGMEVTVDALHGLVYRGRARTQ